MKLISSTAIALVAGLIAAPAAAQMGYSPQPSPPQQTAVQPAQAEAQPAQKGGIKVSSKALKAISELQKAVNAKDVANIPAKLAAAQAVASTKDDRYAIGVLQRDAALAGNDNAALAAAVDALASSGYLEQTKVSALYMDLGIHQFNAKQFSQAVSSFQHATTLTPNDPQALELYAQGLAAAGQNAEAAGAYQRSFQARLASGQKPGEDLYKRAVRAAYDAKSPAAVELARGWLAAYPSPDSWHNALAIYRNLDNPDPATAIDILRLARATDSLQGTGDYHIYAFEAANQANYGEAKSLIAEGLASGKIKAADPIIQEIQGALKGKAAPTAAELAAAEQGAKIPTAFLHVGDRYYGAGNYQKAAELYREAAEKGADANLANLRLGEALARAGDKPGATAALGKVGGPLADVAKFWLVYVQHG
jgi:Flp pilus assembly protein TadD